MRSYVQDGGRDVISRRKVLPLVECPSHQSVNQSINRAAGDAPHVSLKKRNRGLGHRLWLGREWKCVEIRFESALMTTKKHVVKIISEISRQWVPNCLDCIYLVLCCMILSLLSIVWRWTASEEWSGSPEETGYKIKNKCRWINHRRDTEKIVVVWTRIQNGDW